MMKHWIQPVLVVLLVSASTAQPSPYAEHVGRDIRALSADQVVAYETGEGMGLALAAELNGYPGPKHVLELAADLELGDRQVRAVRETFEEMRSAAMDLGRRIVALERRLDRAFARAEITQPALDELVAEVAALQGQLRSTHLAAHLRMVEILDPDQVARYRILRGYGTGSNHEAHAPGSDRHHHRH